MTPWLTNSKTHKPTSSPTLNPTDTAASNSVNLTITDGPADFEIWIDWNIDGHFDDSENSEEIAAFGTLGSGNHDVSISVPESAIKGSTYARVRIYNPGTRLNKPYDVADSGEVEDYQITVADTTLVELLKFDVIRDIKNQVVIDWKTGSELDTAGFNVLRLSKQNGDKYESQNINAALIPSNGNSVEGASYSFKDSPGYGQFLYQLEEIEIDGTTNSYSAKSVDIGPAVSILPLGLDKIALSVDTIEGWNWISLIAAITFTAL